MTALDALTLALAFAALTVSIVNAIVLRHKMRDRVDIVVTTRSLPGDPAPAIRTAIRADDELPLEAWS